VTIATLVFLNGGYFFCCVPFIYGNPSVIMIAGITPVIVTAAPFSFNDLEEFFRPRYGTYVNQPLIVMTGLVNFAFYGASAFASLLACLNQFEIKVDRPRRGFPGYPRNVSREGSLLEEETELSREDIQFVEPGGDEEDPGEGPELDENPGPNSDPAS